MRTRHHLSRHPWAAPLAAALAIGGDVWYGLVLADGAELSPLEPWVLAIELLIAGGAVGLLVAPLLPSREAALSLSAASALILLLLGTWTMPFFPVLLAGVLTLVTTSWATKEIA